MLLHLINYCRCSLQYVVKTVQKLNERFNLHKTSFMHPPQHGNCKIFVSNLLREYIKVQKIGSKLLEKWKAMGGLKEYQWIISFLKREKLKRQNGSKRYRQCIQMDQPIKTTLSFENLYVPSGF